MRASNLFKKKENMILAPWTMCGDVINQKPGNKLTKFLNLAPVTTIPRRLPTNPARWRPIPEMVEEHARSGDTRKRTMGTLPKRRFLNTEDACKSREHEQRTM